MSISEMIIQNEKEFKGAVNLKYFFWPASKQSEYLTVGFSGFNGNESKGEPARYNYVKQLRDFDCHRLFILDDYNNHPCYYLGRNQSLDYEATVMSLIHFIANQHGIPAKNIITCGSSKGGTAAVYFGVKYNLGHVIAGGMQIKVGDYLYSLGGYPTNTVLKLITGESGEAGRDYLNKFYEDSLLGGEIKTNLNLHGGTGDYHYREHVLPFTERLKQMDIPFVLDVQNYSSHGEVGKYFASFLIDQLAKITGQLSIKETSIEKKGKDSLLISCTVPNCFKSDKKLQYAYYIIRDGQSEPVKKMSYTLSPTVEYKVEEPGIYRARVFVRKDGEIVRVGTSSIKI
ncbi:hypothetical protein [Bacillus rhizoplanae]|uniref:hypothetical protein n=1 Tax=Bacillus rhizoplanae TaxID=2880966 RepID=UPI003D1B7A7C